MPRRQSPLIMPSLCRWTEQLVVRDAHRNFKRVNNSPFRYVIVPLTTSTTLVETIRKWGPYFPPDLQQAWSPFFR